MQVDFRRKLLAGTAAQGLFALAATTAQAQILPQGGQVIAGQAQIRQTSPATLSILQTTNRAAITWQSFSIGSGNAVNILQPSASSISVNEVIGANPSQIFGSLTSNGRVVLANPNGIWFGPSAQVDVASIVVTTARPSAADVSGFMSGGSLNLTVAGSPTASIVNQGAVTVGSAGLAAFVAPGVRNSGVIAARLGQVQLASGTTATLDFYGDGLINLAVAGQTLARALGPDGQPLAAAVANDGTINADGGQVLVTANVAKNVVDNVINMAGVTQARAVSMVGGEIVLDGGTDGTVAVSGTLDASAQGAIQNGGTIKVLGNVVEVDSGAKLDASGGAGGGTVLVGGDFHGAGPEPNATATAVANGASIIADAIDTGAGGSIAVWSDGTTIFDGSASAKGGASGGNGGYIETSGKVALGISDDGSVTVAAPQGRAGTWLLDPSNISISTTTAGSITSMTTTAGETLFANTNAAGTANITVGVSTITAALSTGNVTVTTSNLGAQSQTALGDITVGSAITWSSATTLTLQADRNITVSAGITDTNAASGLVLSAGNTTNTGSITISSAINVGSINLTTGASGFASVGAALTAITITTSAPKGVTFTHANGTITTSGGGQNYQNPVVQTGTTTLVDTSTGDITLGSTDNGPSALTIDTSGTISFGGSIGGTTSLAGLTTGTSGSVSFGAGVSAVTASGVITFGNPLTLGGNTTITASGNKAISLAVVSGGSNTLSLSNGSGAITLAGITAGALPITSTGGEALAAGTYAIGAGTYAFANPVGLTGGTYTFSQGTTFSGAVTLSKAGTTINAGANTLTFSSTLTGPEAFTVNGSGTTSFGGVIGTGSSPLSLITGTSESVTIGGGATSAKISGPITISGLLTVGVNTLLNTSAGNAPISLGTVSGAGFTLSLQSGTGAITLNGVTAETLAITNSGLETLNPGTYLTSGGAVTFKSTGGVNVSGTLILGQATTLGSATSTVTLGGNTALDSSAANAALVLDSVSGAGQTLSLTTGSGAITLGGVTVQALPITTTGVETLNTGTYNIGGALYAFANNATLLGTLTLGQDTTFGGTVVLGGSTTLNSSVGNNAITLGTVSGGNNTLSLSSGSGAITLGGVAAKILTISTTGLETLNPGTYTVTNGDTFNSTGGESISGALTFGVATTLGSSTSTVTLTGDTTLTTTTNKTLTLGAVSGTGDNLSLSTGTGAIALNGIDVAAFAITSTGAETLNAGAYTTSTNPFAFPNVATTLTGGTYTFGQGTTLTGAVMLTTTDSTIIATGTNAVTFASTVNGAQALTVDSSGATSFGGSIGLTTPLASLATDAAGSTTFGTSLATVKTSGALTIGDPLALSANTTLGSSTGSGAISLGAVSGASDTLSLTSGTGAITLSGLNITTLAITTTGVETLSPGTYAVVNGATFNSTGGISLSGSLGFSQATTLGSATSTVTLTDDTTITNTNKSLSLGSVSGSGDTLSLSTGTGAITLHGVTVASLTVTTIGVETLNAGSYTVTNGATFNSTGGVSLSGSFTFGQPTTLGGSTSTVTLTGNTTLTNTNNSLFLGPVSGAGDTLSLSTGGGGITLRGATVAALPIATSANETLNGGSYSIGATAYTFNSGAGETLSGDLVLGQSTTFTGAVSLAGNTTLDASAGSNAITLGTVTGNGNSLSLTSGSGVITLNGVTVQALPTTTTAIEVLNAGSYTIGNGVTLYTFADPASLSGTLTLGQPTAFSGAVTLTGATVVAASTNAVTFGSTINGGQSLTVNSSGVTSFAGSIGSTTPLASLATDSSGQLTLGAGVGSVRASGAVTLADPLTILGNTTINTSSGGGAVSLGMVTGSIVTLSLSTGSGAITLNGVTAGGLPIATSGNETLDAGTYAIGTGAAYTFSSTGGETLTGALALSQPTTFGGAVTLSGDTSITDTFAIALGPVSGVGHTLSLTLSSNALTLNGVQVASLQINNASAEALNGGSYSIGAGAFTFAASSGESLSGTLSLGQDTTFANSLTLLGNTTLNSSAGNDAITLAPVTATGQTLALSTGSGAITLNGVATVMALPITTTGVEALNSGTYALGGLYTFSSSGGVQLSGNLTFSQSTTFGTDASLTANTTFVVTGGVAFLNGLSGSNALVVTSGATTLDGTIGVGSLSLQAITLNGTVTTTGGQSYGALTLLADTSLGDTGGGTIAFGSTVDGGYALDVNATGLTSFGGVVGGATRLTSLTVANTSGTTVLNAGAVKTTGVQTYDNAVTLGAGDTLSATVVTFASTVNSAGTAEALTISGAASFGAAAGTSTPLASLSVTGTSTLTGSVSTATDGQSYGGAVTLAADATLGDSAGGAITFDASVNGAQNLTVNTSGTATFDAPVTVASLTVGNSAGKSAVNDGTVTTTGGQFYAGAVTLSAATTLTATTVSFTSTVDSAGSPVALAVTGGASFGGAVGGTTPLTSLTITASGGEIAGSLVHTTGAQLYGGALVIAEDTTLRATTVTFSSDVNSDGHVSVLTVSGNASFGAEVGHAIPLASLTVTGTASVANEINTTAGQSYGGAVTLTGNASFIDQGGGAVIFDSTIDGAHTLSVNASGPVSFGGTVGFTTPVTALTLGGAGVLTLGGGSIATSGDGQTYDGPIVLGGTGATLSDSGGGTMTFVGTIDGTASGAQSLLVSTSGPTSFENSVGAVTPLGSLSVVGGGTEIFSGSIFATAGSQFYGSPLSPIGTLILEATGATADITIAGVTVLDSGSDLTMLAGRNVIVTGMLENQGTGGINLVAGWNGTAGFSGGSFSIDSLLGTANGYGQHGGSVTIGGGGQTAGAVAGSAQGRTVVAGNNVTIEGSNTTVGGFAQIGFSGGGGSGGIEVAATGTVLVEGGSVTGAYAQIGHGGIGAAAGNAGSVIVTGAAVTLAGGTGSSYAQIGHGDASGSGGGDQQGNIDVRASGVLSLATGTPALAVIGHVTSGGTVSNANVTVAAGTLVVDGVTDSLSGGDLFTTASLAPDVAGGAVALAITGGNFAVGAVSYATSNPLSLLAAGELTINGNVTAGGSVTLVGGWNGTAGLPAPGGTFDDAAVLLSTSNYGQGGEGVTLGGGVSAATLAVAGAVTLTADTTLQTSGGDIALPGTIDGSHALTLVEAGTVTLGRSIGTATPLASFTVTDPTGTAALGAGVATVATSGGQSYDTTLAPSGNLTLSHGAGALSLEAVDAAGDALAFTGSGGATFANSVTALSVSVAGPATLALSGGSVATTAGQVYSGGVTLGGDALLTDAASIAFQAGVNGAHALTVNESGATTFAGTTGGTTPLASLTVANGAGTTVLDGAVSTSGAQVYDNAVMLGGAVTLHASAATFAATVDSAATPDALTVSGNASFGAALGGQTPLASLDVTGTAALGGNVSTDAGGQTYGGAVTLVGDTQLSDSTGGAVLFSATVDGAHNLTVSSSGSATFDGVVGGGTALQSLDVAQGAAIFDIPTGATTAAGFSVRTSGPGVTATLTAGAPATFEQGFVGAVTLDTDTVLKSTDGGNLIFAGTVDAAATGGAALTLNTAGAAWFGGNVGAAHALSSLAAGATTFTGSVVNTIGAQTYSGAVTLSGPDAFAATTVTFSSTVRGGALDTTAVGQTVFDGVVSVTSVDTGAVMLNSDAAIETSGHQTYGGAVQVNGGIEVSASFVDAFGPITFKSTLSGPGFLIATPGTTTFEGVVSESTVGGVLEVIGPTVFAIPTAATQTAGFSVRADTQEYSGAVTLGTSTVLNGSVLILFGSTVDAATNGGAGLTLDGNAGFGAAVGQIHPLLNLAGNGRTGISSPVTTAGGGQDYAALGLAGTVTLSDTSGGALVLDNVSDTTGGLTAVTSGNVTLGGTFNVSGTLSLPGSGGTTVIATSLVEAGGAQIYGDPVLLSVNTALYGAPVVLPPGQPADFMTNVTFASTVNAAAVPVGLRINGSASFGAAVGGTSPLSSLTVTGATALGGNVATVTGGQSYGGPVRLIADAMLSDSGVGPITFSGTIDGGHSLNVISAGDATFDAAVGGTTPLTSLMAGSAAGQVTLDAGSVATSGGQTYIADVRLLKATTLSAGAAGIAFDGTVTGSQTLAVTQGATTFDGTVQLSALAVQGASFGPNAGSVTTVSQQTYAGPVTFGGNLALDTNATGTVAIDSTLNGANSLTISAGGASFGGSVGGTTPLASLSVTVANANSIAFSGGSVNTTGGQSYNGAVTISGTETFTAPGAAILFASPVSGGTLVASGGAVTFNGVNLAGLTVTGAETLDSGSYFVGTGDQTYMFAGPITIDGSLGFAQPIVLGGAVTLIADAQLSNNSPINFVSSIDGAFNLTVSDSGTAFGGAIGHTTPLASLTEFIPEALVPGDGTLILIGGFTLPDPPGEVVLTGGTVATTGAQSYSGQVVLGANTTLHATATSFGGTVDSLASPVSLTVTGATTFGGAVGSITPLASLSIGATTLSGGAVATTGAQTYGGALTLGSDEALTSSGGGAITFAGPIDGPGGLSIGTAGTTTFQGAIGAVSPLSFLGITAGPTVFAVPSVATTGAQNFAGSVTLVDNLVLTSSGNGAIGFSGTVDGGASLTVNTGGATVFGAAVGGTTPLASLATDAPGSAAFGNVTTAGAQSYADASVTLNGTYTTNHSTLTVPQAVTLTGSLTVNDTTSAFGPITATGNTSSVDMTFALGPSDSVTFAGDAGSAAGRLGALTVNGGSAFIIDPGFTLYFTTGSVTAAQINLGDTLNLLDGGILTATQGDIIGDLVAGQAVSLVATQGNINADVMDGQTVALIATAGQAAGTYTAPGITVTAPTVAGNYVAQTLTVVGAMNFNITGQIGGQTGAAGAIAIVFVGGTAAETGVFDGFTANGTPVVAPGATNDTIPAGLDVQADTTPQIFNQIAGVLANPNATLGVGATAQPAAGGPATPQELNNIAPTEGGGDDELAKRKKRERRVYDYANGFLDGTLDRK